MNTYVLRYKPMFASVVRSRAERFTATNDEEAVMYALDWVRRKGVDLVILWREEKGDGFTELIDVYRPPN